MNATAPHSRRPSVFSPGHLLFAALDLALLVAVFMMPVAWFYDPLKMSWGPVRFSASWGLKPILIPFLLLVARLLWRRHLRRRGLDGRGLADSRFYKKTCLAVLLPFVLLFLLEGGAKLAGIQPIPSAPIVITDQEHLDTYTEENTILKDPELLFAFVPGSQWKGMRINTHGYRTWEFSAAKPAGTRRLIALGDSCTAQGRPPYSDRLHRLLQDQPPTPDAWESFNMGVFGYSLMQGYRQFLKHGAAFQPDVVTIYFGWNDHWLYDVPDHQRLAVRMNPLAAESIEALRRKRFYGFLARQIRRPAPSGTASDHQTFRVPLDMYRSTLAALIGEIRAGGAIPIVLTAPRRSLHEVLVRSGHARHPAEAEAAHDQYVDATRAVARETGAELLDLAARFAGPEFDPLFSEDGIHFTEDGLQKIAETLHAHLLAMAAAGRLD